MGIVPTVRIEDVEERSEAIGLVEGKLWTAEPEAAARALAAQRAA